jgi:preprotein translocase SecE subunit
VAQSENSRRRPRIRKTAPTVRELVEAAQTKSSDAKPAAPLKRIGANKVFRTAAIPFKVLGRGLAKLTPKYLVNSWRELRQVHWPNRRETWRLTLAVFVFAVVFGAMVAGVDKGLDELFKKVVLK